MKQSITRRAALLAALPAGVIASTVKAEKTVLSSLPQVGEFLRFSDPTTENPIVRLTNPAYTNLLPAPTNRFIASKQRLLIFSSDRYGSLSPHQADLKTGLIRLIAEAKSLDSNSVALDGNARFIYFLDGNSLQRAELGSKHEKNRAETLTEGVTAFSLGASPGELFVVKGTRLARMHQDEETVMAENVTGPCVVKPGGSGCLFWRPAQDGKELWYAPAAAGGAKPVKLASGAIASPCWSANGQTVLVLRDLHQEQAIFSELHEIFPDTGTERRVAPTSQFAAFSPNGDDTVFVGASRSRAQPNIILLLRSVQRELTLCEHHASQASAVKPVFSPNSQRVYFQSDREGKPAIYSVNVELLVDPT